MGSQLSLPAALALLGIGAGALVAPRTTSRLYGLATDDPHGLAFVRGAGARDATLGVLLLAFAARADAAALATTLTASLLVSGTDVALVLANGGPIPAVALHAAGGVGLAALALLLLAGI